MFKLELKKKFKNLGFFGGVFNIKATKKYIINKNNYK